MWRLSSVGASLLARPFASRLAPTAQISLRVFGWPSTDRHKTYPLQEPRANVRVFRNPSLPPRNLAMALHIVLLGTVAQPLSLVSAAPLSVQRSFDVPASTLEDSLNRFAQQANISLPYDRAGARQAGVSPQGPL